MPRHSLALLVTTAAAVLVAPALTGQQRENAPIDLPNGPAKAGFDITRFTNAGNGWFETFYVTKTELLRELYTKYGRQGFVVLGVSIDDPVTKLKPFADQFKM
jgi:hypothetical protein